MSDLKAAFEAVVDKVRNAPEDGDFKPSNEMKLKMYGLYRQATDGDVSGKRPGMLDPVGRFKYDAWAAIKGKAAKRRAEAMVMQAIEAAGSRRVLELPTGMPFRSAVEKAGADHLLFVVHPRGEDWALTTIRKSGDSFEARADLPEAWAGLTDAELEAASGVPGAKFCHNARFIAVAANRDAALRMAELAVAEAG